MKILGTDRKRWGFSYQLRCAKIFILYMINGDMKEEGTYVEAVLKKRQNIAETNIEVSPP